MTFGRCLAPIFLLACAGSFALPAAAQDTLELPQKTTPLPPTTTQERLVNPIGLTELPKYGWHTDTIGAAARRLRRFVRRENLARPLQSP